MTDRVHGPRTALLLVASWPSDAGYAWWLMESFWATLAREYASELRVLLAYPEINEVPATIEEAPIELKRLDFKPGGVGSLWRQCLFLRRHRVKAIYFSDRASWAWRYALFRLFGVRLIIVHDHTPGLRQRPAGIKRWLKRLVHRLPLVPVDAAIGATEFVRRRLVEVNGMPENRTYAAPNGLPPRRLAADALDLYETFAIPRDRMLMIMTGRAHPYKRVGFVLQCLEHLKSRGRSDLHFVFVGAGPHLEELIAEAARRGVSEQCTFTGRRDDVPSLLGGVDLAIHPSRGEVGYSLSILEYMHAGLPTLVPDNPSVSGATSHGDTGLIFPEGDVDAACDQLEGLLDHPERRREIGARAREAAREFGLDRTHEALLRAFRQADEGKGVLRNRAQA